MNSKGKNIKTLIISLVLIAVAIIGASSRAQLASSLESTLDTKEVSNLNTASETTLYVDPPTTTTKVGQKFAVNISISDVNDLYGWEFKLRWNSTLLEALNVTEGDFLKGYSDTFFAININNTEGTLKAVCTLMGDIPGVNGSGTLATVEFEIENEGGCTLDLYDTKLVDSDVQAIIHTAIGGQVATSSSKHPPGGGGAGLGIVIHMY